MPGYYINKGDIKPIPDKKKVIRDGKVAKHNYITYGYCDEKMYLDYGFEKLDHRCLYNADTVVCHRTYALGDVLMTIPVLRQMKKTL